MKQPFIYQMCLYLAEDISHLFKKPFSDFSGLGLKLSEDCTLFQEGFFLTVYLLRVHTFTWIAGHLSRRN